MSTRLTDEICVLLRQLITKLSGFEQDSKEFKTIEKFTHSHVNSSYYYFTEDRRDIERVIFNLGEKFQFHGYLGQADDLKKCAARFFDTANEDLNIRVAVVKFLLELSLSPTTYFTDHPEEFKERFKLEEDFNWASYLNDSKVKAVPSYSYSTTSDDWSETDIGSDDDANLTETVKKIDEVDSSLKVTPKNSERVIIEPKFDVNVEEKLAKEELVNSIQTEWWNREKVCVLPNSEMSEANVAVEWEKFVNSVTMGLVSQPTNIVPEYKIMRELLWQFFAPHSCFSFGFEDSVLLPRTNTSIASIRPDPFKAFLNNFVPYFSMLKTFRDFQNSLLGEYFIASIPDTFRSYNCALQDIMNPVFVKIREIEDTVRLQEQTYTLLSIAKALRPLFKIVKLLHEIHESLVRDFKVEESFKNVTSLLSRLYYGLLNSASKTQQNIYLTLYLETLYKYFTIIETWLTQDLLEDLSDEFIIVDKSQNTQYTKRTEWMWEFVVRELEPFSKADGMLKIVSTKVLQSGKNIHLLRQLGKLHLIKNGTNEDSLHDEYCRTVLSEIDKYINTSENVEKSCSTHTLYKNCVSDVKTAIICPEKDCSSSGMDSLENYIDISDGFLMTVFDSYFYKEHKESKLKRESLYEKIDKNIDRLVPVRQILEQVFIDVLRKRYSVPGLMVKDILITQYELKKHFSLMKHIYLFEDDITLPFYKKMFGQFEGKQTWGNFFWLTSQLQDLLMDLYPELYEWCRVDVEPNWRLCTDPLDAWDLVKVHYRLEWPVDVIIRPEHVAKYHEVFHFLLKLKWAMHTLNRLQFAEIEPRNKLCSPLLLCKIKQLELMRFWLVNDVSSVQHYVLGHLFSSVWRKFDKEFEESYDLDTLISAHDKFITRIHSFCMRLRNFQSNTYGFAKLLALVIELQHMWHNIDSLEDKLLKGCEKEYLKCHKFLRPIIEVDFLF